MSFTDLTCFRYTYRVGMDVFPYQVTTDKGLLHNTITRSLGRFSVVETIDEKKKSTDGSGTGGMNEMQ